MKRAILILSVFGYLISLIAGLDTGLGVYCTPAYCFAAVACAFIAAACVTKRARLYWSIAGIAAFGCSLYGFYQNHEMHESLDRIKAQQPSSAQTETNR
jgi:Gpi18-like mannosyltransferase